MTYFIVGAVILRVRYQKSGTDLIIHKNFWMDLPFLVKVRSYVASCNYIAMYVRTCEYQKLVDILFDKVMLKFASLLLDFSISYKQSLLELLFNMM